VTETRCECCDLPAYSCGKAKEAAQLRERDEQRGRRIAGGHWTAAHYRGVCARCGEPFDVDALIRYAGDGGWLAECCA
jgi:hypothetical protein